MLSFINILTLLCFFIALYRPFEISLHPLFCQCMHILSFDITHNQQSSKSIIMRFFYVASAYLSFASTYAHSWLGCTDHDNKDILEWMKVGVSSYLPSSQEPWFQLQLT
jgi:hypothetical protein